MSKQSKDMMDTSKDVIKDATIKDAETEEGQDAGSINWTTFIIAILALCAILFGVIILPSYFTHHSANSNYNGFTFQQVKSGNLLLWQTEIVVGNQPYTIPFYYHPTETAEVAMSKGVTDWFISAKHPGLIYITLDPDAGSTVVIAGVEISRITGHQYNLLNIDTRSALKAPTTDGSEAPVKTCADATSTQAVLSFDAGNNDIIYPDEKNPYCIHLEYADSIEATRVADRFAYGLLRIMKG